CSSRPARSPRPRAARSSAARPGSPISAAACRGGAADMTALPAAAEIEGWIIDHLVVQLGVSGTQLRPHTRFFELGLDSLEAVTMAEALERWLGTPVTPTIAWEQPTIAALAGHLAGHRSAPAGRWLEVSANTPPAPSSEGHPSDPYATHVNPDLA